MKATALREPAELDAAYSTHRPVLSAIGHSLHIESVIEFGAGRFSTPLFLDRGVFPHLKCLLSVETDSKWAARCRTADTRHTLRLVRNEAAHLEGLEGAHFDLAFVDGDVKTRAMVASRAHQISPLVVLHDAEENIYRSGLRDYRIVAFCTGLTPWTAIATNDEAIGEQIRSLPLRMQSWQ